MFDFRVLILILATTFCCLAYGGQRGSQVKDFVANRDRLGIYVKRAKPKYSGNEYLEPSTVYRPSRIIIRGKNDDNNLLPERFGEVRYKDSGLSKDLPIGEVPPGYDVVGDYGSEFCDLNELSRYDAEQGLLLPNEDINFDDDTTYGNNVRVEKPTRTWLPVGTSYYVDREPFRTSNKLPSNKLNNLQLTRSKDLQSNYLPEKQLPYVVDRLAPYVIDHQPSYVTDRQPYYVTDRHPTYYVTDRPSYYVTDRRIPNLEERTNPTPVETPIRSGRYPTTPQPSDEEYDPEHHDDNVNSNTNYNVVGGARRSSNNINSNANTNQAHRGDHGRGRPRKVTPPNRGSWDDNEGLRSRPYRHPSLYNGSDEEEDETDDYLPMGNANINSNTNSNINARRNNLRTRRSLDEKITKKAERHNVKEEVAKKTNF